MRSSVNGRLGSVILSMALLASISAFSSAWAQELLDPETQPKFVNNLPIPARIDATGGGQYVIEIGETVQALGLVDDDNNPLMTTVWGYGQPGHGPHSLPTSYPGPTFVAMRDVPVRVLWKNKLPTSYDFPNGSHPHLLPVDPTLHMARPSRGGIPVVTHLHGGHTESASDGLPEAWFTQGFREKGAYFEKQNYLYDNSQEAATLWYHDHALGITRLNTYAGLAGFYLLRDSNENQLTQNHVLPGGAYEIEVVIQDRMFTADGQLFYPSSDPELEPGFPPLPDGPTVIAEFFGDIILVNGAPWPKLNVEPRKYRLRYLNGSDSRFYLLEFRNAQSGGTAQPFLQIGSDDGLLEHPVQMTRLLLGPGERADLVVDFDGQTALYLRNFGADEPFKGFNPDGSLSDGEGGTLDPADPATTGQIMKFVVDQPLSSVPDATVGTGTSLRPTISPLVQTGATRHLVLFEGLDQFGRLQPMVGTLAEGSLTWFQPITENPMLNDVEVWEIYNTTADAHPMHLHLVAFQLINRESFTGTVEEKVQPQHDGSEGVGGILDADSIVLGGDAVGPNPNEVGWKDTVPMMPGQVTRVIAKFDRPGRYVWHCHILSHEDHEMMRPYQVGPIPAGKALAQDGIAQLDGSVLLGANVPNPFNPSTQISFHLPQQSDVELKIFDLRGELVRTLAAGTYPAGENVVEWNGRDDYQRSMPSGMYFYQMRTGDLVQQKSMLLVK